jgi:hypothetical protein
MAAGEATFTAAHSLSPPSSVGETYMAEGPKIASAPSRNGVIADRSSTDRRTEAHVLRDASRRVLAHRD